MTTDQCISEWIFFLADGIHKIGGWLEKNAITSALGLVVAICTLLTKYIDSFRASQLYAIELTKVKETISALEKNHSEKITAASLVITDKLREINILIDQVEDTRSISLELREKVHQLHLYADEAIGFIQAYFALVAVQPYDIAKLAITDMEGKVYDFLKMKLSLEMIERELDLPPIRTFRSDVSMFFIAAQKGSRLKCYPGIRFRFLFFRYGALRLILVPTLFIKRLLRGSKQDP